MSLLAGHEKGQLQVVLGVEAMQPGEDLLGIGEGLRSCMVERSMELFGGQGINDWRGGGFVVSVRRVE